MIVDRILTAVTDDVASALSCDPSRCLRMRYADSSCNRCVTVCTSQAIDLSEGLALDRQRCTTCLACTTACPAGALEAAVDCTSLFKALEGHQQDCFVLSCRRNASKQTHYQLPCLGMLSHEHLLALAVRIRTPLQVDISHCCDCNANGMLATLSSLLDQVTRLQPPRHTIQLVDTAGQLDYHSEQLDRRSFFSSFRKLAVQKAQVMLAPVETACEKRSYGDKMLPRRRSLLLEIRDLLTQQALSAHSRTITFRSNCSGCLGCVRVCPTGALLPQHDHIETPAPPLFKQDYCTGCSLCTEFCLDQSIELQ